MKKRLLPMFWGLSIFGAITLSSSFTDNSLHFFGIEVKLSQDILEFKWYELVTIINSASASTNNKPIIQSVQTITSKDLIIPEGKIEASGIVWNPKTEHYLLISDEEYKDLGNLFIMNEEAVVTARLSMQGGEQHIIGDLESISTDGNYFYILSSLSHNKKDKLKSKRKKFLRFKYQQQHITEQQDIDLYKILIAIKETQTTDKELAVFLQQAIKNHSMDIESHFVHNNDLYLGFKSPYVNKHNTLLIRLHDVKAMFEGKIPRADIWQSIALLDPKTEKPMLLSDMIWVDDHLFLLSVSRSKKKKSVLWHYQLKENTLQPIKQFPKLNAEGISYRHEHSMFIVVFDEGKKTPSKSVTVPYSLRRVTSEVPTR